MTVPLFLAFVGFMAAVVLAMSARHLAGRVRFAVLAGLPIWLLYVGLLSYFGVVRNTAMRPPGIAFIFVPVLVFLAVVAVRLRSGAGVRVAVSFPIWVLLGVQSFRIIVELFLHQLWKDGLIPRVLTFAGANVDIYVGLSAPLIAWWSTRGRSVTKWTIVWNVLGLLALANVVCRAVLTAPGPLNHIHAEVPNLMIGTFPYTFIPGFFVPLAVLLHVLALRAATTPGPARG